MNQTRMETFTELQGGHVDSAEIGLLRFAAGFLLLLNFPDTARLHRGVTRIKST